jgi:RNA polymerase-binding transcription factor DksA
VWLKTGDLIYRQIYRFWLNIFAMGFGIGVVTGIVLSFEFGHGRRGVRPSCAAQHRRIGPDDASSPTEREGGSAMNVERYRQRLLAEEQRLSDRVERALADVRAPGDGAAHDSGDDSVIDELKDDQLTAAGRERAGLGEVRDALNRIVNGTFGTCVVDGGPIEAERLEALPWTPYCLRHQQSRESTQPQRRPTL